MGARRFRSPEDDALRNRSNLSQVRNNLITSPTNWLQGQSLLLVYIGVVLLTYGYQIFSYAISLDEEMYALSDAQGTAHAWLSQSRWAMGLASFLVPSVLGPAVSPGVGVALFSFTIWRVAHQFLKLKGLPLLLSASMAVSLPVMIFAFDFDTIAFGLGIGFLLCWLSLTFISRDGLKNNLIASLLFATALAIYEPLALFIIIVVAAQSFQNPSASFLRKIIWIVLSGTLTSKLVSYGFSFFLKIQVDGYQSSYLQLDGLISDPLLRVSQTMANMSSLYELSGARYGLDNPWGKAAWAILFTSAIMAVFHQGGKEGRTIRIFSLAILLLLPSGLQLLNEWPLPLRIFIFLPAQVIGLSAIFFQLASSKRFEKRPIVIAIITVFLSLAVLGNASQTNRIIATSRTAYVLDQFVAHEIEIEKAKLFPESTRDAIPLRMMGQISRVSTRIKPVLPSEGVGVSLFGFGLGETFRVTRFLSTQGILFTPDSAENPELDRLLRQMPSYPSPGWAKAYQGTFLIKFSVEPLQE